MLSETKKIKIQTIHMLFSLFQSQESYSITSYDSVDEFYSYIGYDLESENLLHSLNVHSTSGLMALLSDHNAYLDGDLPEEDFVKRFEKEN